MSQYPELPDWAVPGPAPASTVKQRDTRRVQERHMVRIGAIYPGSVTAAALEPGVVGGLGGGNVPYGNVGSIGPSNDQQLYVRVDDGDGAGSTGLWQFETGAWVRVGPPAKHASQHARTGADPLIGLDAYYAPQWPNLIAPYDPHLISGVSNLSAANNLFLTRVIVPQAGTLRDISAYIGASSGNVIAAVYDDGTANPGSHTKIWDSGSHAAGTANTWQIFGSTILSVTAGQHLMLGIMADNTTVSFGRITAVNAAAVQLPNNFIPAPGGAPPILNGFEAEGSFAAPATVSTALTTHANMPCVIARVI